MEGILVSNVAFSETIFIYYTSRDFLMDTLVKALKAPGGPSKLTIATNAWRDSSFHAPNKAEIIVEWILHNFLKQDPYG